MKSILQDLKFEEIENLILSYGEKKFRAKQLYDGLMKGKKISEINISADLKARLLETFEDEPVKIIKTLTSKLDGTEKYLFSLADGNVIEGVLMKYKYGNTQCVSTQVGCRMGCKFCASTLGGLVRNLTSGEILAQVLTVNALHANGKQRGVTNIVLMGSGEPLDNYENVVSFLKNVSAEGGVNISPRNISLSTCGLVPKIYALADEGLPVNLTVSLHQTTDGGRARTMPIAKKYSIDEILKACEHYFEKTGRRYIFEYSLIAGENCANHDAQNLIRLLKGKPCHVNLIRLNEVEERGLKSVSDKQAYAFMQTLIDGGLSASVRRSLGSDIAGACGQLRVSYLKNS
ncbi:MAG: 23S rRNA (adenine(2503)-C(2))-methyltransferase RlmN [Clostridia bacterium]|nr:23S rRNA (adenine(2503)-C(2))-methyltransferase RlmN [Clostridia bacterium]